MQAKNKICSGCKKPKKIWKSLRKEKLCQGCWNKHPEKSKPVKSIPKPINKKSTKQQKLELAYGVLRTRFLKDHPYCQAKLPGCTGRSSQVHHKKGRIGDLLLDTAFWLAVDDHCHRFIELNPDVSKQLGLSESRLESNLCTNCNENERSKDNKWCMACRMEG